MAGLDAETIRFYDDEAEVYAQVVPGADPIRLKAFVDRLPSGARVLEIGCGGGHDALAMRSLGLSVTATDASAPMARQAELRLGTPVKVMAASDLSDHDAYDGVWASASLLHVPRPGLTDVLKRIHAALVPGGLLYASFKSGDAEGRDSLNRYYNFPSEDWLRNALSAAGNWQDIVITYEDGDSYDGRPATWLHLLARK